MRTREHNARLVALLVSGGAHLALLAWVYRLPPEVIAPKVVTVEFQFEEPKPPPKPPAPPPEPEPRPAPPVVRAVRRPVEPPVVASEPPPPAPLPRDVPPPDDTPRELRVTPDSLFAKGASDFVLSLDAGAPEPQVVTGRLRGLEPPKDLVGDLARETLGRGRVERGLVHTYYSSLGKALLKHWDAERVARSGLKGLLEQTQQNAKLYNDIWLERAQAYGGSGNPMGDVTLSNNRRAPVNNNIGGLPGVDLEARKELSRQLREQFKATRRAVIRVVQDEGGKLKRVELVQPSSDAKVDTEALQDVKAAAQQLPPPTPDVLDGKRELSSLWSFELVVSISPPVPAFTFEFDEALGFVDVRLPLDRRIYKKVRLVSVE